VTREIGANILLGGVAPYVAYVLLRPHFAEVTSLAIASLFPAVLEIVSLARHRRLDPVSTLSLVALAVSVAIATTGGSARFMLMKESLVTGAIGVGFLISLLFRRPAQFYLGRQFVTGNVPERVARYNAAWEAVPYMRAVLRTTTTVWGIAFLIEVTLRVLLVFRLSTQQMLVVGPIVFYSTMLTVIAWTVFYVRRTQPRIKAILDRPY
jgi:intracellular septation protein A